MEIIVGKNAGFCYGVKRAVDGAIEELNNADKEKNIYCLGEIVHNKDVVNSLEKKGMKFIDDISASKGLTIIRAHGVPESVYSKAKQMNIQIRDFTCPKVLKIHEIADKYSKREFYIFLTGSKVHPENIGTMSYCGNNYFVIENKDMIEDAIKEFKKSDLKKLLLISQTTFSMEKFDIIKNLISEKIDKDVEFLIKNTICAATRIRQEEVAKVAKEVDKMIIIGGKNSSNTKKLFDISKMYCNESISIENENQFDLFFFEKNDKIGIMAGASTPQESIDKVIFKLNSLN